MNEQPSILDKNDNKVGISINSIISNPLYFGQKDLSFTQNRYAFDLLQKLVGNKIKIQLDSIDSYVLKLDNSIKDLLQLSSIPTKIKELNTTKQNLEHKLKIFHEKSIAEKLNKQTSYNKDHNKIDYLVKQVNATYLKIQKAYSEIDKNQFILSDYNSEFSGELFGNINDILKKFLTDIDKISAEIEVISKNENSLRTITDQFDKDIKSLKEEFASIKREIQDDTLDPDSFVTYTSKLDKVKQNIEKLNKKNNSRESLILDIKKSMRKRNEVLSNIFNKYEEEIKKINDCQNKLKIKIKFKGSKDKFKNDIKAKFRGAGISDVKAGTIANAFSDFVSIISYFILDDTKKLHSILTDNEVIKVYDKIKDNYSELIKEVCPDLVEIYYHDKLLEQHSIGQKASALILFVLTQENNDLIIIANQKMI